MDPNHPKPTHLADWLEGELDVNGRRLHFYRSGGRKPPVVLVHGFTDNALYWSRTAEALASGWDVVMYDARGHGRSERARGEFSEADRVSDLAGVIAALGLDRPGCIGHSMGAATIAHAAAQHPDLARWIVLEDPAWHEPSNAAGPQGARRLVEIDAWREWVRGLQSGSFEDGLAQIKAASPGWSELDQRLSLAARREFELALFDYYPTDVLPWRSVLPRITCPILLLLGDNRERSAIVTVEQAEEAARLWRAGRWAQIPGAGHSIRFDQFDRYLQAVQAFLREMA